MPRPALTEEQRRATRRRIRRAASELYAEAGLSRISARAVAERAGVSVGTLYTHFDNLTDLMRSLWRAPVARLYQEMRELAESTPDPVDRLTLLMRRYVRFAAEEASVYRGAFLFVRPQTDEQPEALPPGRNDFLRLLGDAISQGQAQGSVRAGDPEAMAQLIWAALHGANALPINIDLLFFTFVQTTT